MSAEIPGAFTPNGDERYTVVVPVADSALREVIAPGAGCVARPSGDGWLLDYEDNDRDVRPLSRFVDRVAAAATRAHADAATRDRVFVMDPDELTVVGSYLPTERLLEISDRGALAGWLGVMHISEEHLVSEADAQIARAQLDLF